MVASFLIPCFSREDLLKLFRCQSVRFQTFQNFIAFVITKLSLQLLSVLEVLQLALLFQCHIFALQRSTRNSGFLASIGRAWWYHARDPLNLLGAAIRVEPRTTSRRGVAP